MNPAAAPFPNDSISIMLRQHGMPEPDIAHLSRKAALVNSAAFGAVSWAYFSRLPDDEPADPSSPRAQAHAYFSALAPSARDRLAALVWQAQAMRKPSKMGQIASEARRIAGPHAPLAMACMLDSMAMSMAGSPDPLSAKLSMIAIVARHVAGAPQEILIGVAARCCYHPDPDLLGALLASGALAHGPGHLGHSPLAMAARQYGSSTSMSKEKLQAIECMRLLLAHGAPAESFDEHGRSALGVAANHHFWQACHLLLDHRADPFSTGPDGRPIDALLAMEETASRAVGIQEARSMAEALGSASPAAVSRKPRI